jgi:glucokinase
MLREQFGLPVFINNDGDLFAYGEAIAGFLPAINNKLKQAGSAKKYSNLLGVTLGTGFGGGIVRNGQLFVGDNSVAGEIWVGRNGIYPHTFAEESISIRGVLYEYNKLHKAEANASLTPEDVYHIAAGKKEGNKEAAHLAYMVFGQALADALANAITLIDGLIVIGGGLSGAYELFIQTVLNEMNGTIPSLGNEPTPRLEMKVFNLEDDNALELFIKGEQKQISIPGSKKTDTYDQLKRIGIGISKLGTSRATAIGAYAYALSQLDGN